MRKRYGLLGHKIAYSLSPRMHNAAFKFLGIDASYEVFDIAPGGLEGFFKSLIREGIKGLNVTIPHKEGVLQFIDEQDRGTSFIGAVNTILVKEDGRIAGYNTDHIGFLKALTEDLRFSPAGNEIFFFGAGGAARGCSYLLISGGARNIFVTDIDTERTKKLVADLSTLGISKVCDVIEVPAEKKDLIKKYVSSADLIVNATPCGMKDSDPELFDYGILSKKQSVFDLIYTKNTPLVETARAKGLKAINGLSMLLYQGAESFKIWTGKEAPIAEMRKALGKR